MATPPRHSRRGCDHARLAARKSVGSAQTGLGRMNGSPLQMYLGHSRFERPEHAERVAFYVVSVLLIFLLKSIVLLRAGALYGRLSFPPAYDDVTYFVDALQRLRVLLDSG